MSRHFADKECLSQFKMAEFYFWIFDSNGRRLVSDTEAGVNTLHIHGLSSTAFMFKELLDVGTYTMKARQLDSNEMTGPMPIAFLTFANKSKAVFV